MTAKAVANTIERSTELTNNFARTPSQRSLPGFLHAANSSIVERAAGQLAFFDTSLRAIEGVLDGENPNPDIAAGLFIGSRLADQWRDLQAVVRLALERAGQLDQADKERLAQEEEDRADSEAHSIHSFWLDGLAKGIEWERLKSDADNLPESPVGKRFNPEAFLSNLPKVPEDLPANTHDPETGRELPEQKMALTKFGEFQRLFYIALDSADGKGRPTGALGADVIRHLVDEAGAEVVLRAEEWLSNLVVGIVNSSDPESDKVVGLVTYLRDHGLVSAYRDAKYELYKKNSDAQKVNIPSAFDEMEDGNRA